MPCYEYQCRQCHGKFQLYRLIEERDKIAKCPDCKTVCKRVPSMCSVVTDTNFGYTGKYDPRLGGPKIEGRKDWYNRVQVQGKEITDYESNKTRSNDTAKRIKEKVGIDIDLNARPAKWKTRKEAGV